MKIKPTTAFKVFTGIARDRANADKSFMVRSVNKDGSVSKMKLTADDWKLDAFAAREDAEKRLAELEKMNPGRRYTIVDLH